MASVCRRKTGGYDMRDGVLTRVEGEERVEETLLTVPVELSGLLCGYS